MKLTDDELRAALKADAGLLPVVDEALYERLLTPPPPAEAGWGRGASGGTSWQLHAHRPLLTSPGGRGIREALLAALALAACVVFGFVYRTAPAGPEDVSADLAAFTAAARPTVELADLPFRPYRQNLAALHDDAQRLGRFVVRQLDVMPEQRLNQ